MSNTSTNGLTIRNNSLLARLLASENITVVHSHTVQSAAFELNTRTLILPMWKTDKQEVYDFLVGHEVGHALYTPASEWKAAAERIGGKGNARIAQDFINVVEDARIERMIKRQYPGLREDFKVGYQTLQEMDIFQTNGKDIGTMRFIDRLNLHFKVGIHCGVEIPFTAQELAIVNRIVAATTFEQVEQLAAEVYEMEKQQKRDQQDQQGNGNAGGEGDQQKQDRKSKPSNDSNSDKSEKSETREAGNEDKSEQAESSEDGDDDGDESSASASRGEDDAEGDDDGSTAESSDETDEGAQSRQDDSSEGENGTDATEQNDNVPNAPSTSQNLTDGMKKFIDFDLVEETIRVRNIDPNKVVIGCDEFAALCDKYIVGHAYARCADVKVEIAQQSIEAFNEMTKNSRRAVDLMCKRFEVKRAAKNFARESSAKTGRISPRLLNKYKFSEDIFDKVIIKRDEKNHGIVIMLDWSGSMQSMVSSCADQIGALLHFCRRAGIPAQVYFFTSALVPSMDQEFCRNNPNNKSSRAAATRWGASHGVKWSQDTEALAFTDHVCNLPKGTTAKGGNAIYQPFSLVKVYDSTMTNSKFQQVFGRFLLIAQMNGRGGDHTRNLALKEEFLLGTTPLDESILAMRPIIANFRKSSNAKISFLAITDGEGTSIVHGYDELETDIKAMQPKKLSRVLIDDATGIRFTVQDSRSYSVQTNDFVVQMLKASTGCSAVGIMLLSDKNPLNRNITYTRGVLLAHPEFTKPNKNGYGYVEYTEAYRAFNEKAQEQFEENAVFSMAFGAWDQYFFVGISDARNAEWEAKKDQARFDKMKNRKVAVTREFISELKREETNRMFINRLMDIVA
jgi:hypothetical protein